ncbi:hypothetical protein R9C00_02595 [Flammeovirgaceae bacterium SG7u.111]|nr:hypothetical protein [Flammeovirgaceae bacterium SG7u.132]WPO36329.1 hypothetical protein R9C00_02595 [Flammeovirgaceae bacterium SG7u.111]
MDVKDVAQNIIVAVAVSCLILGLFSYYYYSKDTNRKNFNSAIVITWLLIAIFPAFLISFFFPSAQADGSFMGFKVGGAFGAFILTWYYGVKASTKGIDTDKLRADLDKLKRERAQQTMMDNSKEGKRIAKPLAFKDIYRYKIKQVPSKEIRLITGNITQVDEVDIWVNSENTNMQLARFYDNSISGIIRYLGASRHKVSKMVDKDTIYEELKAKLVGILRVESTAVISTIAGELERSNNVKQVFHVASSRGQPGHGYLPIENIQDCIVSCLKEAELAEYKELNPKSILFPLMGTGTAGRDLFQTADLLINTAVAYMEDNPDCQIDHVYFLNYTDLDLGLCQKVLDEQVRVTPIR